MTALAIVVALVGPATGAVVPAAAQGGPVGSVAATSGVPGPPSVAPRARDASSLGSVPGMSVVLVEGSTGQVIAASDAARRRPIASAMKLVTAMVVVDALPPGSLVQVGEEVRAVEGSSFGLRPGETHSIEDLLAGLLLRSGNDVGVAVAHAVSGDELAFVERMRERLADLGIEAAPGSATGLDLDDALSAEELAVVARAALEEPRIREVVGRGEWPLTNGDMVENRNLFVGRFSGATGLKTGFTSAAGYTLVASARRDGRELVAVVLGASDDAERRAVAAGLLEYGFDRTDVRSIERSVTLRTSRGPVQFSIESLRLTLQEGMEVRADWPLTLRADDVLSDVMLRVDGSAAGAAPVTRRDATSPTTTAGLGAALVDGAYAAMRPFGLAGALR